MEGDKDDTANETTLNSEDDEVLDFPVDSAEDGKRSESEMAKDVGPQGKGGAGRSGRHGVVRQEATAIMMDKALSCFAKGIMVREDAKKFLKERAKTFLGELLCRDELAGSMDPKMVRNAIDVWIPKGNAGEKMRSVPPSPPTVI
jgi:hypothetical protein